MTNQDNHHNHVVQDMERVANEVADVLVEIHRNDADGTIYLDVGIDFLCRQTLHNLTDEKFRESWTQFHSLYNGVK